jgi:hypothetical protein
MLDWNGERRQSAAGVQRLAGGYRQVASLLCSVVSYFTYSTTGVTVRTVRFNSQQFYVLPTQCIYVFCVDLRTNSDISLYSIDWLVFITETECLYCAVRSTFYVLPTQCFYVSCVDLRTNSDFLTVKH